MDLPKRYKLIACEVLFREICKAASRCESIIDIVFMTKGLHDIGESKMSEKLQEEINNVDPDKYQVILLGYGLCNNGISGLHSSLPMVIPRAHDCITLLFGSKEAYNEYFQNNPGTFFKSSGWLERDEDPKANAKSTTSQLGMNKTYQEYIEQYGEENAQFIIESLGDWRKNYNRLTYIDTNCGNSQKYKEISRQQALSNNWKYDEVNGNVNLLFHLLNGEWNKEDFLIVPPNKIIKPSYSNSIITFESF
jgi:hypothetical protein